MEQRIERLKKGLTTIFVVLTILSIIFCMYGYLNGYFKSVEKFQTYVKGFGIFAPMILTMIQAMQVVLPILPGFFGSIAGVGMFGAAGSFWCNYIGISAGSVIAFWLARKYGAPLVRKMIPMEKYQSFVDWVNTKKSYTLVLFLSILLPLAPDDFLCYFSGLTEMSSCRFTWIIMLAKPWCILFYSILFSYLIC